MKGRLAVYAALAVFAVAAMGQEGCETQSSGGNKPGKPARDRDRGGFSNRDLADTAAEVVISNKGQQWLDEFCSNMDLIGRRLALRGFKSGYSAQGTGVPARMAFNAIADRC